MASSAELRRVEVQPRRPGPPPARLDVQGDGADGRAARGRRPGRHVLRLASRRPRSTTRRCGPDRRQDLRRHERRRLSCAGRRCSPTTPSTSSSRSTSAPTRSSRPRDDLGITSKLNGYPAETLGGLEHGVSPLEMANAYATIAYGGYRNRPTAITQGRSPTATSSRAELPARWRVKRTKAFYGRRHLRGDQDPRAEHAGRHRHARPDRLPRRRQDRHDRQQHRRLVRRLHAAARRPPCGSAIPTRPRSR